MNYRIVVDAGHGGNDPGAVSGNLKEKDYALKAANYMFNRFRELGIPVTITRDTDRTLSRNERLNTMRSLGTDSDVIILSNHINAGGGDNPSGKLTFFEKNKTRFITSESSFINLYLFFVFCLIYQNHLLA